MTKFGVEEAGGPDTRLWEATRPQLALWGHARPTLHRRWQSQGGCAGMVAGGFSAGGEDGAEEEPRERQGRGEDSTTQVSTLGWCLAEMRPPEHH